jgi:hypothetical protein
VICGVNFIHLQAYHKFTRQTQTFELTSLTWLLTNSWLSHSWKSSHAATPRFGHQWIPECHRFMTPYFHRLATSRLRKFMIPDLHRSATSGLRRFKIPDLYRFATSGLRRFEIPDLHRFATLGLRRLKIPDLHRFVSRGFAGSRFQIFTGSRLRGS